MPNACCMMSVDEEKIRIVVNCDCYKPVNLFASKPNKSDPYAVDFEETTEPAPQKMAHGSMIRGSSGVGSDPRLEGSHPLPY